MTESHDRRELILSEAAALFAKKGISATTVREIADSVGILSGSLYHYFPSKDDMVNTIMLDYLGDLTGRYDTVMSTASDPYSQLSELIRTSLEVIETHPHATEIYQTNGGYFARLKSHEQIRDAAARISSTWVGVIEAGISSGAFRPDIPPRVLYRLLRDSLWLSVRWFRPSDEYSRHKFGDDLVATYCEGILPR